MCPSPPSMRLAAAWLSSPSLPATHWYWPLSPTWINWVFSIQCIFKSQIYLVFGIRCIFKTKYIWYSVFGAFLVLGIRSKLTIQPNTDLDPPDGEAPCAGAHSGAGHKDLTILQPVDIEHREAIHCAVEHSSAATVCHLLRWEDVNWEGGGHLQHVLHHVLVHL